MFSAKDKAGQVVTITKANVDRLSQEHGSFYCQCCNMPLIIKNGSFKQPHFAHPHDSNCVLHHQGESEHHKKGKLDIANWALLQAIPFHLEKFYPEIARQADLELATRYVVEFQCATIPTSQLMKRTEDYIQVNKQVVWLLGQMIECKKDRYLLTRFQQAFINVDKKLGYYLLLYSPKNESFELLYQLAFERGNRFFARKIKLPLKLSLREMKNCINSLDCPSASIKRNDMLERERICYYYSRYKSHSHFMRKVYQSGYYLQNLPREIGVTLTFQFLTRTPQMEWQFDLAYYFFSGLELGDIFQFSTIQSYFNRYTVPSPSVYLKQNERKQLLKQYLLYLEDRGIIIEFTKNYYRLKRKLLLTTQMSAY